MPEELKPCPFCGSKAKIFTSEDDGGYRSSIYCMSGNDIGCFARASHWALKKSWAIASAKSAWNRRTEEAHP